ncbi:MAG TPA: hypothetical protein PKA33_19495 [Amaricoccus sp.]|nr:hypothetical protein [Amaricoccus sp.]HMU01520.1 hypothetical protein [Amaricoccus sp.]
MTPPRREAVRPSDHDLEQMPERAAEEGCGGRSDVGLGGKASKHFEGIAFDIVMANHDPEAFEAAARRSHIDLDPAWSRREPLPKHATAFAESPARSSAAEWPVGYPEP